MTERRDLDQLGREDEFDELDEESLQTSTGGGMGTESYPPEDDENVGGNGADRGPS